METITSLEEFEKLLEEFDYLLAYIYAPWSGRSEIGLKRIKQVHLHHFPNFIIIDIGSDNSFIYSWLDSKLITKGKVDEKAKRSSIHGNGELIGIRGSKLEWFENCTMDLNQEQLMSLIAL